MGSVWLAYSESAKGHCAVKVLNLRNDRRGSAERSFNREVRAMARLDHRCVIEVHDYGRTERGSPFVAMEFVDGSSLHPYTRGPWTWEQLWWLLDGLLSGLGHAHAREMIHRDLKPGNVLIRPGIQALGGVKLVDFGIALGVQEAGQASRRIEGTPAYIAPEAAKGDVAAIGPWTDLYSLGVMLFEILTGDLPFHGRHLLAHHQSSPLPAIKIRDDVQAPEGLIPIVKRLMSKSPVSRFRSVASLRHALAPLAPTGGGRPLGPPPSLISWDDDEPETVEPIFPLQGPSGPALFHLREPPIAGREEAQASLLEAVRLVVRGAGPQVVLIEGEAGQGKSRLARWLREQVQESGQMRAMLVRSEPQTQAGGGLRAAVMRFLGAPIADTKTAPKVFEEAFDDPRIREIAHHVLYSDVDDRNLAAVETRINQATELIRTLADDRPFLLWADDAQWSPEGRVLRLVHHLARPGGPPGMLIIVTLRPSMRHTVQKARRALLRLANVQRIKLGPISPRVLAPALEAIAPLPPGLAEAACMQSAGNPLIALEALRGFLEAEGLGSAPADPQAVLEQRINQATRGVQGAELRSTLARATLLGRSFTLEPLTHLCGVGGDDAVPKLCADSDYVDAIMERAVEAGLAIEQGAGRWRYSHDLVRTQFRAVARALPNWTALNLAAAELRMARAEQDATGIEFEMVARHRWEGQQHAQAMKLGMEGIHRLHQAGLMGNTASFARRLLGWDDKGQLLTPEQRGQLRLVASDASEHSGKQNEAMRHAHAAVEIARRNYLPALGARAASRVGILRLQSGELEEAEQWLWDALRFARRSSDDEARSSAHLSLGRFYQHRDQLDLARTAFEASLDSAQQGGLVADELQARGALARIDRLEDNVGAATDRFEDILDVAQQAGLEVVALVCRLELGLCAWACDDSAAAQEHFEEARRGARGNLFIMEFYACLGLAWAFAASRQWTDAEILLMQADDLRYDVRLHDPEAERLRQSLRELAQKARRNDIIRRVDRLKSAVSRRSTDTVVAWSISETRA